MEATINVRFVDDQEQDPTVLHRRRLQVRRTQNYRLRQRANQDGRATDYQAGSLSSPVESTTENGQTGPKNSSLIGDGGVGQADVSADGAFTILVQEGDDLGIDIEPAYFDEELVHCTGEREDPTEPQSPEFHVEARVDLPDESAWTDVERATQKFIQQFLVGIHGCGTQEHRESLTAHIEAEGAYNHHGLDQLFPLNLPHTLDKEHFLTRQTCNGTQYPNPGQWQELFSGHRTEHFDGKPKQTCLHTEHTQEIPPVISFDIDSILGFVTSPAAALHRIRFYSAPQYRQNIYTDVHLTLDRVDPGPERPRLIPSRLKDVPHFIFAKVEGADFITLHLFFPHLPCYHDFNRLTDEQLSRWFDAIFYPAVRQVYDVDRLQHLTASYRHALATCRAPQVEDRLLETPSYRTQLRMSYFLPPQGLQQLWDYILTAVNQPGFQDFRNPELFLEANDT